MMATKKLQLLGDSLSIEVSDEQVTTAVNKYFTEKSIKIETDDTLSYTDGVLSVNTDDEVKENSDLPITSGAVYSAIGNVEDLLKTI